MIITISTTHPPHLVAHHLHGPPPLRRPPRQALQRCVLRGAIRAERGALDASQGEKRLLPVVLAGDGNGMA